MLIIKRLKTVGGVQHKAWWGIRLAMELPMYHHFSSRCKDVNVILLTTEKENIAGIDEYGVYFCPTLKMNSGRKIVSSKSVDTLMREFDDFNKQD